MIDESEISSLKHFYKQLGANFIFLTCSCSGTDKLNESPLEYF